MPVVQEQGLIVTVQDGKVTRTEAYNSVDDALVQADRLTATEEASAELLGQSDDDALGAT